MSDGEAIYHGVCKAPDLAAAIARLPSGSLGDLRRYCVTLPATGLGGVIAAQVTVEAATRWFQLHPGGDR